MKSYKNSKIAIKFTNSRKIISKKVRFEWACVCVIVRATSYHHPCLFFLLLPHTYINIKAELQNEERFPVFLLLCMIFYVEFVCELTHKKLNVCLYICGDTQNRTQKKKFNLNKINIKVIIILHVCSLIRNMMKKEGETFSLVRRICQKESQHKKNSNERHTKTYNFAFHAANIIYAQQF